MENKILVAPVTFKQAPCCFCIRKHPTSSENQQALGPNPLESPPVQAVLKCVGALEKSYLPFISAALVPNVPVDWDTGLHHRRERKGEENAVIVGSSGLKTHVSLLSCGE